MRQIISFYFKNAPRLFRKISFSKACFLCGCPEIKYSRPVISNDLAKAWNLNDQQIEFLNQREGEICIFCGASLRVRHLAKAILDWNGLIGKAKSLASAIKENHFQSLSVCEINSCGALHNFLLKIPALAYSEFGSTHPLIPSQDLSALTYPTESFDLLLHSDTLEHVSNLQLALSEIKRVLKPGAVSIFTVPIIPDGRPTRQIAVQQTDGTIEFLLPPTYHGGLDKANWRYLVFHEFGCDFFNLLTNVGFEVKVLSHEANPLVISILAKK